ncbi:OPT superfamily [Asimina triloba]
MCGDPILKRTFRISCWGKVLIKLLVFLEGTDPKGTNRVPHREFKACYAIPDLDRLLFIAIKKISSDLYMEKCWIRLLWVPDEVILLRTQPHGQLDTGPDRPTPNLKDILLRAPSNIPGLKSEDIEDLKKPSFASALHEKENRPKGQLTRNQFFVIATICSFAYYVFPGYIFPMLTSLSWICWVFPSSVVAHQLGSGLHGLGVGALGLDWSTTSSYLGSPLASPWFATANVAVGFFVLVYIITPIAYWLDVYSAKTFPVFSNSLFTKSGHEYNISSIIDSDFHLDVEAYQRNGPLYLSILFALSYGAGFATLSATVVHIILFHGRELLQMSKSAFKEMRMDIHTRLMQQYKKVPEWWFMCMLAVTIAVTIFACESYNEQL